MTPRSFEDIAAELRTLKASEEALTARLKEENQIFDKARADYAAAEQRCADTRLDIGEDLASVRAAIQAETQALRDVKVTPSEAPPAEPAAVEKAEELEALPIEAEAASIAESEPVKIEARNVDGFLVNPFTGLTHRNAS